MISTPNELTANVLHKAIGRYYKELRDYESKGSTELNLRPAFQSLLAGMARRVNLTPLHLKGVQECQHAGQRAAAT